MNRTLLQTIARITFSAFYTNTYPITIRRKMPLVLWWAAFQRIQSSFKSSWAWMASSPWSLSLAWLDASPSHLPLAGNWLQLPFSLPCHSFCWLHIFVSDMKSSLRAWMQRFMPRAPSLLRRPFADFEPSLHWRWRILSYNGTLTYWIGRRPKLLERPGGRH